MTSGQIRTESMAYLAGVTIFCKKQGEVGEVVALTINVSAGR